MWYTRDFAGFMLRNLFGYHAPSGLLLLEDAQSTQIQKYFGPWAVCRFKEILVTIKYTVNLL